jgi:hypothetical protein
VKGLNAYNMFDKIKILHIEYGKFEDAIKGVIKSRKSKKDRLYNDHKKTNRRTNNDLQNTTQKTKDQLQLELKCSERVSMFCSTC